MDSDFVRKALLEVWGRQACQRPKDWPAVQAAMLARWDTVVNAAVRQLLELFSGQTPADPARAVWRCFPRLDREHCAELAAQLSEAARVKPLRLAVADEAWR